MQCECGPTCPPCPRQPTACTVRPRPRRRWCRASYNSSSFFAQFSPIKATAELPARLHSAHATAKISRSAVPTDDDDDLSRVGAGVAGSGRLAGRVIEQVSEHNLLHWPTLRWIRRRTAQKVLSVFVGGVAGKYKYSFFAFRSSHLGSREIFPRGFGMSACANRMTDSSSQPFLPLVLHANFSASHKLRGRAAYLFNHSK